MKNGSASTSVWVGDHAVCIKIAGRANLHASMELKDVVRLLTDKGHTRFLLDLTDCLLMDSTFLGVLARMGINASAPDATPQTVTISLLNPNPRVRELLDTLGVAHFFQIHEGKPAEVLHMDALRPTVAPSDRKELAKTSLEAHQTLMEINPKNIPKFKDVTKFLAEELKELDGTSSSENSET